MATHPLPEGATKIALPMNHSPGRGLPRAVSTSPTHRVVDVAANAARTVVETVDRCYRIQDTKGSERQWDAFTAGRYAGYTQTLALLLGIETREVARMLSERAL
jgi:hypothetical protein